MAKIKLDPEEDSVNIGDFFLDRKTKEVYIVGHVGPEKYILICLNDGERWSDSSENIEGVFGFNDKSRFEKITNLFTVIP
jgi:hypothetical protein